MALGLPVAEIISVLAGSVLSIIFALLSEYSKLFDVARRIIGRVYKSPVFIILFLATLGFISHIFNAFGIIESHLSGIYLFIYSITIATYFVSYIAYVINETKITTSDFQPPLGWLGDVGLGPAGFFIGDLIKVLGLFQLSKLLIYGVTLGNWGLSLSFTNEALLNILAFALGGGAGASVGVRWLNLSQEWDTVIENIEDQWRDF